MYIFFECVYAHLGHVKYIKKFTSEKKSTAANPEKIIWLFFTFASPLYLAKRTPAK